MLLGVANGAGMPALGLSAAAVLVKALLWGVIRGFPHTPKGENWSK